MEEVQTQYGVETQASLGVFGTDIDCELISKQLRLQPSHSHRAGDAGLTSRFYPQDLWLLESPLSHSETLDAHLNWLRDALAPNYEFLRILKTRYEIRSYCGVSVSGSSCLLRVSPEALKIFIDLGVSMNVTVVFIGDSMTETQQSGSVGDSATIAGDIVLFEVEGNAGDIGEIAAELSPLAEYFSQPDVPGRGVMASQAYLTVESPGDVRPGGLNAQLIWMASELSVYSSFVRSMFGRVKLLVRCVVRSENDISDRSLSPEGLSFFASLGAPLELEIKLATGA